MGVDRGKMRFAAFNGPSSKTAYRRKNLLRKPNYSPFCPKFRCHGNGGRSGNNAIGSIRWPIFENPPIGVLKVNNRSADCSDVSVIPTIVSARCCRRPAAAAAAGRREPRSSVIIPVQRCSLQNNVNIDLLNVCLLGNKHASLCDHIASNDVHFFVTVET